MSSNIVRLSADKLRVLKISDGFKIVIFAMLSLVLVACADESSSSSSGSGSGSGSSGSASSELIGTWSLDSAQAQGGNVTISFDSNGRGENVIDVSGFQKETRGYSYRESGDQLFLTYDEVGAEGTPSTITELTSTKLTLRNPDNSTGFYTRVGSSGSGSGSGSSSTSSGTAGISVWMSTSALGSVDVYIDGTKRGTLMDAFISVPTSFGHRFNVTVTGLAPGSHTIRADSGATGGTWGPTTVNLDAGDQLLYELR